jgi:tetratricopeptide (TPR) repeat protein
MRRLVSFFIIVLLILSSLVFITLEVRKAQIEEMAYLVQNLEGQGQSNLALSVVSQIDYLRRRLENPEEDLEQYRRESRIQVLGSRIALMVPTQAEFRQIPFLLVLIRRFFQRPEVNLSDSSQYIEALSVAFYLERNQAYEAAKTRYEEILENPIQGLLLDIIHLHLSYCYLELGELNKSLSLAIALKTSDQTEVVTAARMIEQFIMELRRRESQLNLAEMPLLERGKALYVTMQYEKAAAAFQEALETIENQESQEILELWYRLGRTVERSGRQADALHYYSRIMTLEPDSDWALQSARRTLMVDDFYDVELKGAPEAYTILEQAGDPLIRGALKRENYAAEDRPEVIVERPPVGAMIFKASAQILSDPPGATIEIDGKVRGKSPIFLADLDPGKRQVVARLGKEVQQATLELVAGRVLRQEFQFQPLPASLRVVHNFPSVEVLINGNPLPFSALARWEDLSPGTVVIQVIGRRPRGESIFLEKIVRLRSGENVLRVP